MHHLTFLITFIIASLSNLFFVVSENQTMNPSTAPEPQKNDLHLNLKQGTARIECSGNPLEVVIATTTEKGVATQNQITLTHDDMLKLAFQLLLSPEIRERFPHAALPAELSASALRHDQQEAILKKYRTTYKESFGEQDQFGSSNVLGPLKRTLKPVTWGGDGLVLSLASPEGTSQQLWNVQTKGPISIHLLVDVMVAFVSDNQTRGAFPQFAAPYIRRWGEDAFQGGRLKSDIPEILNRDAKLRPLADEDEQELGGIFGGQKSRTPSKTIQPVAEPTTAAPDLSKASGPVFSELKPETPNTPPTPAPAEVAQAANSNATPSEREIDLEKREKEFQKWAENQRHKLEKRKNELDARQLRIETREHEVESRNNSSRNTRDLSKAEGVLKAREKDLARREQELKEQTAELELKRVEYERRLGVLTRSEDAIRGKRIALEKFAQEWEPKQTQFEKNAAQLLNEKAEMDKKSAELATREKELISQQRALDKEREQVRTKTDDLAQKHELLQKLERSLAEREREVENALTQPAADRVLDAELQRRAEEMETSERKLEERERVVIAQEKQIEERRDALAKRALELEEQEETLSRKRQSFDDEMTELFKAVEKREEDVAQKLRAATDIEKSIGGLIVRRFIRPDTKH